MLYDIIAETNNTFINFNCPICFTKNMSTTQVIFTWRGKQICDKCLNILIPDIFFSAKTLVIAAYELRDDNKVNMDLDFGVKHLNKLIKGGNYV